MECLFDRHKMFTKATINIFTTPNHLNEFYEIGFCRNGVVAPKLFWLTSSTISGFRVLIPPLQFLLQMNFSDHYIWNLFPQLSKAKAEIKSSLIK